MNTVKEKIELKLQELAKLAMADKPKETKPEPTPKPDEPKPVEKPEPKPFNTLVDLNAETIPDGDYIISVKGNVIAEVEQVEAVEMTEEEFELAFGAPEGNQNAVGAHNMGTAASGAKKALWKSRNKRAFKKLAWNQEKSAASGAQGKAAASGKSFYNIKARRAAVLGKGKAFTRNVRIAASEQKPEDNVQLTKTDVLKLMHAKDKEQSKTEIKK
jgi:hypothetical protein